MSMTLRAASSLFPGFPTFFRRRAPVKVEMPAPRVQPAPAKPAATPAKPPAPAPAIANIDFEKLLISARKAPLELAPIEWSGDMPATPAAPALEGGTDLGPEARQRRIRDRYIGARFPGVARSAADLSPPSRVIKAARLYFEDGRLENALELLDLAIEQDSRAESLWLAQLEILFLSRESARFVECARAFRAMHPASEAWAEVARLGQSLAPKQSIFGAPAEARAHAHYGPWPDLPNWIQANWDLTGEMLAADFHRALGRHARKQP